MAASPGPAITGPRPRPWSGRRATAGGSPVPRPGPGRARPAPGRAHAVSGAATTGQGGATAPAPPTANARPYAAGPWPLRESLELGALPGAVPCARLHARQILWEWALTPLTEAVEHVVSELMANAVAAARARPDIEPVRLWLLSDSRSALVLVWDADPGRPVLTEPGEDAESGRGLFLVQAFSDRWGSYATPHLGGKVVWALCGGAAREPGGGFWLRS